jgi:hypothetical protein
LVRLERHAFQGSVSNGGLRASWPLQRESPKAAIRLAESTIDLTKISDKPVGGWRAL